MIQICGNRDPAQEAEVLHWIGQVLGAKLPEDKAYSTRSFFFWSTVINTIFEYSDIRFEDVLKDGVVLCHLMNKISPGSIKKVQERGTNFQLMENIQRYSKWCVWGREGSLVSDENCFHDFQQVSHSSKDHWYGVSVWWFIFHAANRII